MLTPQSSPAFPWEEDVNAEKREFAESLDKKDSLAHFREQFIIPTTQDLTRKTIIPSANEDKSTYSRCTYLCGNSLGLQPKSTRTYVDRFLQTWATKGVLGHFTPHEDELTAPFVDMDTRAADLMAPVVGALPSEVAVMDTLTTNLHLLMASFYRPTAEKYKIILEGKAFPSDHFAVESQIRHHNLDPDNAMILIEPEDPRNPLLSTEKIISVINAHAASTALILLPAIQYYTGQYFDIAKITAHAHSKNIAIGWDCAHAAGNVELKLHDWNVDFAAWCTYKYLNSGPGAMGALFVHERHGIVDTNTSLGGPGYRPRLSGWWGGDKDTRFEMDNRFKPRTGAAGFQLSNPSALDLSAVLASLEIFSAATMPAVRQKSIQLTAYLEHLLLKACPQQESGPKLFSIITPSNPMWRGAQLSVLLRGDILDGVFSRLLDSGIVVDERKPNVIRVAPAPLYNTFVDVWNFVQIFVKACEETERQAAEQGK
ncbi:kynureninase [Histoplasma capsulatum G186AR]|uniref:Kynureninase n=2 Tax=Ajellomyces capsulatus TaxID=5037 RepID=C0NVD3_AJECG|nr:kynureninase [Histoplasma capsulatum G186AR]EEH04472.1 kynureninase [Histoplasma capsulatum G186AR]